jgi:hypothetical protein
LKAAAALRTAHIESVAIWTPALPDWTVARAAFRGEGDSVSPPARRPAPELLPAAERRRAPDTVALALEVAAKAVEASGIRAEDLLSVFTSAHGDLAINDYVCSTLVTAPTLLSPTKFHNSVHNAASGYWGIATGCMQASTAVSAFKCSFAVGLFEALTQCAADERPVLLVGYDIAACGPLLSTNESRGLLAAALVLAPHPGARSLAHLDWSLKHGPSECIALQSEAALPLATNAMSDALPLLEALARRDAKPFAMPLSKDLALDVSLRHGAER